MEKQFKKALFIVNPHAGKGLIKNHLLSILNTLTEAGYLVTTYITQSQGDAIQVTRERERDYDLVVCSGGDGTLDEIVTGMMQSGFQTKIGYIPAGSTNDFAKSLKLPSSMKKAAEIVAADNTYACDVGVFNEDVFVYVAAFGIFTEVSYGTPQELKNMLGHTAYLLEGMKQIQNIKSYHMKVTSNECVIEGDFIYGMITNSYSIGGIKNITGREVALNDGLFEVTLIRRPNNLIELNKVLAALVSDKIDADCMYTFKTSSIVLESMEEVAWTLDGEFGGKHTKVELFNKQEAMEIIVKG
ncbi:MAG: YegS/Rv2252/BmrU family lipid kinase [Lachnospiraceae bacterium]|nr:YegS/Rv2252/BmrU family lipid kinase [Lachnospiraceae bacterium]MEE1257942.1 YegS/Rv2252/BmrU family lipid kinase [Lachnospiraceae bacterium]